MLRCTCCGSSSLSAAVPHLFLLPSRSGGRPACAEIGKAVSPDSFSFGMAVWGRRARSWSGSCGARSRSLSGATING